VYENLGVCKGPGEILAHLQVGSDCINISKVGKYFNALLNNRTIISARTEKDFIKKASPVLSHIVNKVCVNAKTDSLRWKRVEHNYTKMIDNVLEDIEKDGKPAKVFVLEVKPDQIQDNRTTGYQASSKGNIVHKLDEYRFHLKKFGETIENLNQTSGVLLRTDLDKNMWGSKKVMDIISDVKYDTDLLARDYKKMDCCLERSEDNAQKMQIIAKRRAPVIQAKKIAGNVIENFALMKSFMSELAQVLHRLYIIDGTFKSCVGYPATWFFDGSIFMDFMFEYENLIGHLIKSASLETDTIEPLLVWKIKLTGVE